MSEADTPMNESGLPESIELNQASSTPTSANSPDGSDAVPGREEDWETVDFPNALSVDAIARQTSSDSNPTSNSNTQPTEFASPAEAVAALSLPDIEELVQVIHELQQRNTYLLERVTQLEGILGDYNTTLQAQAARSQEQDLLMQHQAEDLQLASDHISRLMHELECSHQAAQRQQILVETIAGQLESSQERVAQLERECALTQQRCNEQTHLLIQSENTCRDLRSRLNRQQRYTLQFKAALEKSLEMPAPCFDSIPASVSAKSSDTANQWAEAPFLPKVQSIQPWSAEPWLTEEDFQPASDFNSDETHDPAAKDAEPALKIDSASPTATDTSSDLPLLDASVLQVPLKPPSSIPAPEPRAEKTAAQPSGSTAIATPHRSGPQPALSYDLKKKPTRSTTESSNPIAYHSSVETTLTSAYPAAQVAEAEPPAQALTENPTIDIIPEPIQDTLSTDVSSEQTVPPETLVNQTASSADLESSDLDEADSTEVLPALTETEEQIWQDLAKLIDASVSAVHSNTLSDLEQAELLAQELAQLQDAVQALGQMEPPSELSVESQFAIAPEEPTQPAQPSITPERPTVPPASQPEASDRPTTRSPLDDFTQGEDGFAIYPSWPSPIVYPLRPQKKRASLAAVELPMFPRPQ